MNLSPYARSSIRAAADRHVAELGYVPRVIKVALAARFGV